MMSSTVRTLIALPPPDRILLLEALTLMVFLRAGLRVLRFTTIERYIHRCMVKSRDESGPDKIGWAVGAVGSRLQRTTCLVEALAAECMLRRRGHRSALKIGVRRGTDAGIDAHAWVECSGAVVIGTAPALSEYVVLSSDPHGSAGVDPRIENTSRATNLRSRLSNALRRVKGPVRLRTACLYLSAGLLTLRQLRAASIVRWETYAAADSDGAGFQDWEARLFGEVLQPGERVLLIGCGTGRDLVELAKLGCDVTGVEQSQALAGEARARLRSLGLAGVVEAGAVESYATERTYDAVIVSLYTYSYIIGSRSRIAVLSRAREHLSPRGRIILSYAALQRQSPLWIFLAWMSSFYSAGDWRPQAGDRLYCAQSHPDVLHLEHQFTPEEIARECHAAGLRIIRDEAISPLFRFAIAAV